MIIVKNYDENARVENVFFKSSNVYFCECKDIKDELKQLTVVFNNGAKYLYKDVDVSDYLMFSRGGLDGSQGKALNKYIKPKYEFVKLENADMTELNTLRDVLLEEQSKQMVNENSETGDILNEPVSESN